MHSAWFKGHKDKEARKKELRSYKTGFDEAIALLKEHFEETVPDYDEPSWAYHQADHNGANRKLQQVIKLLTIED